MASGTNTSLSHFIGSANAYPKLTREEELALWNRWRNHGDLEARENLVRATLRYSVSLALKYRSYDVPVSELIAEGNFGLVQALAKFNPAKGTRFVTYAAYWMRAYILEYIIRGWSLVGPGTGPLRTRLFFKLRRERARIHNLVGEGEQANALLAARFGFSIEQMASVMRRLEVRDLSVDLKASDNSVTRIIDTLRHEGASQEQLMLNEEAGMLQRQTVRKALGVLNNRERFIAERRLMCDPEEELSLAEVGRRFGISRERARQIERRTRQKLRSRIAELDTTGRAINGDTRSCA